MLMVCSASVLSRDSICLSLQVHSCSCLRYQSCSPLRRSPFEWSELSLEGSPATSEGGRRPTAPEVWVDQLERRIGLFEQGSTRALWPELAKVKQQAEAQATAPTQASKAHSEATLSRTAPSMTKAPPPDSKRTGRERWPRMGRS